MIEPLLAAAGVLSIVQASPGIVRRLAVGMAPGGVVVVCSAPASPCGRR